MSSTAPEQQNQSRDLAIAAIRQALREIGDAGERLAQVNETAPRLDLRQEYEKAFPPIPAERQIRPAETRRRTAGSRGRPVVWSVVGILASAGIGVAAFGWQSTHEQETQADPVSTGSVSTAPREPVERVVVQGAAATKPDAEIQQPSSEPQTTPQRAAQAVLQTVTTAPDPAPLVHELATSEPAIDQLKADRTQTVRDNPDLADRLRAAQEIARQNTDSADEFKSALAQITRQNADLAEEVKAMRAQMARDSADFTERLKAGSEQMARLADQLKASQEQIARLTAVEQKPRPKPVATLPQPAANATPRKPPTALAPSSSQARAQTQDPRRLVQQPKQQ
jgi:hypothetical protein